MPSQETTSAGIVYTETVVNSVGLVGLSDTPDLLAIIFPTFTGAEEEVIYTNLSAFIRGTSSGHTQTGRSIYVDIVEAGIGLNGLSLAPDLHAIYKSSPRVLSGTSDLLATIYATQQGDDEFLGYIKSAESGSSDLYATFSGYFSQELTGYIRPSISGSDDLSGLIEPVPGADLVGELLGISADNLPADIYPVPPEDLVAEVTGVPALDLYSDIFGYSSYVIAADIFGYSIENLVSTIHGYSSATKDLLGTIRGVLAVDEESIVAGYILSSNAEESDVVGEISGVSIKNLNASIFPSISGELLQASYSGNWTQDVLFGLVTSTGSTLDLLSYVIGNDSITLDLGTEISGHQEQALIAEINNDSSGWLTGEIAGVEKLDNILEAFLLPTEVGDLSGNYSTEEGGSLRSEILPVPGIDLYATVTPKVFYIDSSILINTVPVSSLKALINSTECGPLSNYSDLHVFISGTSSSSLGASIISVSGQYSYTTDAIRILPKNKVTSADWVFLIVKPPVIFQEKLPIIITTHPFSDLSALIDGVQVSTDLESSISPIYIPSVRRAGSPIGEWVNTRTGERKLLKLFFRGNVDNFYYSPSANKVYAENSDDYLEIVVESYQKIDATESLLTTKTSIKQCAIGRLTDFPSIDEAVKFAILYANSEIAEDLQASIFPVGSPESLSAEIESISSTYIKDLYFRINPVENMPDLEASISSEGEVQTISAQILPQEAGVTSTPFFDTEGNRYLPTLQILPNGDYTVVLLPISPLETIDVISPDLYTSISGQEITDLLVTISG
jgi:hypothetical protein